MIFVISGPSGCGKSTLIGRVRRALPDLRFSVSHTTRKRRPSETDGVDYHFVTERTFRRMIRERRFVEWAEVHGRLYGTSRAELARREKQGDVLLDIDVQGARQVRKKVPRAVMIFVMPPGIRELRKRLERRREDSAEAIERRLQDAGGETRAFREFDYIVVNNDLERAAGELTSIIVAGRLRTGVRAGVLRPILRSFSPVSGRAAKKGSS
jgi:guanylate kinase